MKSPHVLLSSLCFLLQQNFSRQPIWALSRLTHNGTEVNEAPPYHTSSRLLLHSFHSDVSYIRPITRIVGRQMENLLCFLSATARIVPFSTLILGNHRNFWNDNLHYRWLLNYLALTIYKFSQNISRNFLHPSSRDSRILLWFQCLHFPVIVHYHRRHYFGCLGVFRVCGLFYFFWFRKWFICLGISLCWPSRRGRWHIFRPTILFFDCVHGFLCFFDGNCSLLEWYFLLFFLWLRACWKYSESTRNWTIFCYAIYNNDSLAFSNVVFCTPDGSVLLNLTTWIF